MPRKPPMPLDRVGEGVHVAHSLFTIPGRRLFTPLAALSFLLCLATIALWGRTYGSWRIVKFWTEGHYESCAWFLSTPGVLSIARNSEMRVEIPYRWICVATVSLPSLWAVLFFHRKRERRVFTIFSVFSLILCLTIVTLWVRSYSEFDSYTTKRFATSSVAGAIFFGHTKGPWEMRTGHAVVASESVFGRDIRNSIQRNSPNPWWPSHPWWEWIGFSHVQYDGFALRLRVPHWFLALVFGILPSCWIIGAFRSRRRHHEGHCRRCGYDLRATPERCPECGTCPPNVTRYIPRG